MNMAPSTKKKGKSKTPGRKTPPPSPKLKWISTRLLDDVFTDEVSLFKPYFKVDYEAYLKRLWDSNPEIYKILKNATELEQAREDLFDYLERAERKV
jgi:hypothetical protein